MSQKRFIGHVRNYAAAARRLRRSFAEPVYHLLAREQARVEALDLPPEVKAKMQLQLEKVVEQEYVPFDATLPQADSG